MHLSKSLTSCICCTLVTLESKSLYSEFYMARWNLPISRNSYYLHIAEFEVRTANLIPEGYLLLKHTIRDGCLHSGLQQNVVLVYTFSTGFNWSGPSHTLFCWGFQVHQQEKVSSQVTWSMGINIWVVGRLQTLGRSLDQMQMLPTEWKCLNHWTLVVTEISFEKDTVLN